MHRYVFVSSRTLFQAVVEFDVDNPQKGVRNVTADSCLSEFADSHMLPGLEPLGDAALGAAAAS